MNNFLKELWLQKEGMREWNKKYWSGINALNRSYEGVSLQDFIVCLMTWDDIATEFLKKD